MSMGPPPQAVQDLKIGKTAVAVYRTLLRHPMGLLRAALIPVTLSVLLLVLAHWTAKGYFLALIFSCVELGPYTMFAVAWHRLILLGPAGAPRTFAPSWQKRHWRFLLYALAINMVAAGLAVLFSVITDTIAGGGANSEERGIPSFVVLGMVITSNFVLYVVLRLSFVLPAVAVDESYGLADSWRQTKGQGWRLFLAMLLTVLPIWLVLFIILNLPLMVNSYAESEPGRPGTLTFLIMLVATKYIGVGLYVTLVSVAFRICSGWTPCAPSRPPSSGDPNPTEQGDDA